MKAACSDQDFMSLIKEHGATEAARRLGVNLRNVHARRARLEKKYNASIEAPDQRSTRVASNHDARLNTYIHDGVAIVFSDAHYWPDMISTAHRALVRFVEREKNLKLVCANGDVLDGSTISRHPPIGWENRPSLVAEVEACKDRLSEIEKASLKTARGVQRVWNLGNHDGRFETRLATVAPEYAKLHGVHLHDHFPLWQPAWSLWINDNTVVKHRFRNGVHAPWNNTMYAGKSIVTGHLHSSKVTPFTDYNGTRYGVDTGTLAVPGGPQFIDYLEDNPVNWRSGFGVLTFNQGRLLYPELVTVFDEEAGIVQFRGELIHV